MIDLKLKWNWKRIKMGLSLVYSGERLIQKSKSMKKKVVLQRYKEDENQSTGVLLVIDENGWPVFASPCIERGDRDNQRNVSNVPPGRYPLKLEWSPRFKMNLWELKDVPNRSECKIHASNFWNQLNGCIAPGDMLSDLNGDKYQDVTNSRVTLERFHTAMKGVTESVIEIHDPS